MVELGFSELFRRTKLLKFKLALLGISCRIYLPTSHLAPAKNSIFGWIDNEKINGPTLVHTAFSLINPIHIPNTVQLFKLRNQAAMQPFKTNLLLVVIIRALGVRLRLTYSTQLPSYQLPHQICFPSSTQRRFLDP